MELEEFFEFERRFVVPQRLLPPLDGGTLLLQVYLVAREGYSVRVRLEVNANLDPAVLQMDTALPALIDACAPQCSAAWLAVKGPAVAGVRFEREMELPAAVGLELARQGAAFVVKTRFPLVSGEDLWVIDVFHGANQGLAIAEVERADHLEDVHVPSFCGREVTDAPGYSNEDLAFTPLCCR